MAKTDPHALGLPFSCWSLAKLTAHLAREKITRVGREAIRRIRRTNGTDHRSHDEQNQAIARYVRRRNTRARPKRGFAINSKIRSSDWQANHQAKVSC